MAVAYVKSTENAANSAATTITSTASNLLVFFCDNSAGSGTGAITQVAGNVGGNWTQLYSGTSGSAQGFASCFYLKNIPSGLTTVTATFNGGSTPAATQILIVELSGADPVAPIITNAQAAQASPGTTANAIKSGTGAGSSVSVANAYILGVVMNGGDSDTVAGSSGGPPSGTAAMTWTSRRASDANYFVEDGAIGSTTGTTQAEATAATHGGGDTYFTTMIAVAAPSGTVQADQSINPLMGVLRLGTPVSRLRGWYDPEVPPPLPVIPGEPEVAQPLGLRLGTPFSRLRGVYGGDTVPGSTAFISGIALGTGPASGVLTGKGALAGLALGTGPVLASIKGSAALAGAAFAQGPVKGAIGGTANLLSVATGSGFTIAAMGGSGALTAKAVGAGFVYSGVSGSAVLTGAALGVGPVLGGLTSLSLASGQGVAGAFGYALSTISFTFVPPSDAGRHHKRYSLKIGDRTIYYATKSEAVAARTRHNETLAVQAKAEDKPFRKVRIRLREEPMVVPRVRAERRAQAIQKPQDPPSDDIARAVAEARAREDEEIAIALILSLH